MGSSSPSRRIVETMEGRHPGSTTSPVLSTTFATWVPGFAVVMTGRPLASMPVSFSSDLLCDYPTAPLQPLFGHCVPGWCRPLGNHCTESPFARSCGLWSGTAATNLARPLRIPEDKKVKGAPERLQRYLAPVDCEVAFRQITARLRRRAALFDELRGVLRLATTPQEVETEHDLQRMQEKLNELVASLKTRRPERGPAQDIRQAIDIVLKHIDSHGANLWGHAIGLPESAGPGS